MKQGKRGPDAPIVKRCIVVCPCSLVNNWAQEFEKWVNCRVKTEAEKVYGKLYGHKETFLPQKRDLYDALQSNEGYHHFG
jgi:SNF2 family DNA or RNA helicase